MIPKLHQTPNLTIFFFFYHKLKCKIKLNLKSFLILCLTFVCVEDYDWILYLKNIFTHFVDFCLGLMDGLDCVLMVAGLGVYVNFVRVLC